MKNKVLKIFNKLSDIEKKYLSKPLVNKHIYVYVIEDKGFIEIRPLNNHIGFILIAVSPEYRRKNITKILVDNAIIECRKKHLSKLLWRCKKDNIPSQKCAIYNGFVPSKECPLYKGYVFERLL